MGAPISEIISLHSVSEGQEYMKHFKSTCFPFHDSLYTVRGSYVAVPLPLAFNFWGCTLISVKGKKY
jgi:hypothetical protein